MMLIRAIYGLPVGGICARFRSGYWSTRGDVVIYVPSQLQHYSSEGNHLEVLHTVTLHCKSIFDPNRRTKNGNFFPAKHRFIYFNWFYNDKFYNSTFVTTTFACVSLDMCRKNKNEILNIFNVYVIIRPIIFNHLFKLLKYRIYIMIRLLDIYCYIPWKTPIGQIDALFSLLVDINRFSDTDSRPGCCFE